MSTPIEIASFGHSGSHTSQLMHSSVMIRDMLGLSSRLWVGRNLTDFVFQPLFHRWKHELADIAAKLRNLAHDGSRNKLILVRWRHEHGFDIGQKIAIHARHLEFVFKVGHSAQPTHNHARVVLAHEILQKALKTHYLHVRIMTEHFVRYVQPLLQAEKRLLVA